MNTYSHDRVRVRFAPSPTGHLHIGGLRAAIFNWLFARHAQGIFCVRIEDTDLVRSLPEYTDSILKTLSWCNLQSDEPLLIQSSRFQEHTQSLQKLLELKKAYYCYCTPEQLAARQQIEHGVDLEFVHYDGFCRNRTDKPSREASIRFAVPRDKETITFYDIIRGSVSFATDLIDDFIIARQNGGPLYNFVVVCDDAYMNISHILRGEEHLSNTPKQILLYEALGYPIPHFAHVPLILGPDGNKLSKRDAATSVLDYKRDGYLPEALINYLVRLGWSHGNQEIFTRQELIDYFSLEHVGKKGAIFDKEKLDWVNSMHIRALTSDALYEYTLQHVEPDLAQKLAVWDKATIIALIALYKERVKTVRELVDHLLKLSQAPVMYNEQEVQTWMTPETIGYISYFEKRCEQIDSMTIESVSTIAKEICKDFGIKLISLAQPIRLALVGATVSPGVFELLALLGKDESLQRIRSLIDLVQRRKAN